MNRKRILIIFGLLGIILFFYISINNDQKVHIDEKNEKIEVSQAQAGKSTDYTNKNEDSKSISSTDTKDNAMTSKILELQEINPDVFAILHIPGTNISYPTVYNEDNEFYLRRDLKGNYSLPGTVFLDYENNLFSDNLIFYGHNMGNGTMFSDLMNYKDREFFDSHDQLDLYLVDDINKYQVHGAYLIDLTYVNPGIYFNEYINWDDDINALDYLDSLEGSLIHKNDDIEVFPASQFITLSTCTYESSDARLLLVAIKKAS